MFFTFFDDQDTVVLLPETLMSLNHMAKSEGRLGLLKRAPGQQVLWLMQLAVRIANQETKHDGQNRPAKPAGLLMF